MTMNPLSWWQSYWNSSWLRRIVIGLGVLLCLLMIFRNTILKTALMLAGEEFLGVEVRVDDFSMGLIKQSLQIKGLKIFQPQGYPKGYLIHIPELRVDYDLKKLLKGTVHISSVVLRIDEVVLIKNKDGILNVNMLTVVQKNSQKKPPEKEDKEKSDFQIGTVTLELGEVIRQTINPDDTIKTHVYEINMKKTLSSVSNPTKLVMAILLVEVITPIYMTYI